MIFASSNQFGRRGVPGGGLGCFLMTLLGLALLYFLLKGLYKLLYLLSPGLLVLALILNWRVFPDTVRNWLKSLETNPLGALFNAALAVLLFPFFSLYILLKAAGMNKMDRMRRQFGQGPGATDGREETEFVEFEELESRPKGQKPTETPMEAPDLPEKEARKPAQPQNAPPPPKPENPYDQLFD
jgi:hypothetical protein